MRIVEDLPAPFGPRKPERLSPADLDVESRRPRVKSPNDLRSPLGRINTSSPHARLGSAAGAG
jgi:hypothetical protein